MDHQFPLSFTDWIERLEELATEGGFALPLDLSRFEPQYRAGQTPIEALEDFTTGRAIL